MNFRKSCFVRRSRTTGKGFEISDFIGCERLLGRKGIGVWVGSDKGRRVMLNRCCMIHGSEDAPDLSCKLRFRGASL